MIRGSSPSRVPFPLSRLFPAALAVLAGACATTRPASFSKSALDAAVAGASRRCACRIGVSARHLESGRTYEIRADSEFESAAVV